MKIIEKISAKFTKSASVQAKKEIRKTIVDLLPAAITVVGAIAGVIIFKNSGKNESVHRRYPGVTNTKITTNNYFLNDLSEDMIKKILEESRYER